jgi:hypothetical protein
MNFDLTALATAVILQLAAHGVEGIAERDIDINVGVVLGGLARRNQGLIGHRDINAHAVMIAVLMVLMGLLDSDPAACDLVAIAFEFCRQGANAGVDRSGMLNVVKAHFQGHLHQEFSDSGRGRVGLAVVGWR